MSTENQPGAFERQLLRRHQNPLFGSPTVSEQAFAAARERDQQEIQQFHSDLESTVTQCLQLDAHAESEQVLRLKNTLERLYESSCGLAGDHSREQQALVGVIDSIMSAIEKGAADDPVAVNHLQDEKLARQQHFELLQNTLIADLLRQESPIAEDELTATLLTASAETLPLVLTFFNPDQLQLLYNEATDLLQSLASQDTEYQTKIKARLDQINDHLSHLQSGSNTEHG